MSGLKHKPRKPVILIKVLGAADGYWNPTAGSSIIGRLAKFEENNISTRPPFTNATVNPTLLPEDRVVQVFNFRPNIPTVGKFYLCFLLDGTYVIDNQSVFVEYQ